MALPVFLWSYEILETLGQDEKTTLYASQYLKSAVPGLLMIGLVDADRNFITAFGESKITVYTQVFAPILHPIFIYIFTSYLNLDVKGIGYAMFFTNTSILYIQKFFIRREQKVQVALKVSILDKRIYSSLFAYVKLAIPSLLFIYIEFSAWNFQQIMAGMLGVKTLATETILF
jgi:Na+-driven multidrug efflux pump